jgi:hypothetical protein
MSTRVALLGLWTPRRLKSWGLERLFPIRDRLAQFAAFTCEHALRALREGDPEPERLLHRGAFTFGRELRRRARADSERAALHLARIAYRSLGIDFRARGNESVISRCWFARCYSAPVYRFVSALDRGLICGLTGFRMIFTGRITECCETCRGRLEAA